MEQVKSKKNTFDCILNVFAWLSFFVALILAVAVFLSSFSGTDNGNMWENNIYRVFFIFDEGNVVVLFSGFQKKTQKTPQSEIDKAIRIKEAYYADKRPSNQGL